MAMDDDTTTATAPQAPPAKPAPTALKPAPPAPEPVLQAESLPWNAYRPPGGR
jgi:hypothetical protein